MAEGIIREKTTENPSNGQETREKKTIEEQTATQEAAMLEIGGHKRSLPNITKAKQKSLRNAHQKDTNMT